MIKQAFLDGYNPQETPATPSKTLDIGDVSLRNPQYPRGFFPKIVRSMSLQPGLNAVAITQVMPKYTRDTKINFKDPAFMKLLANSVFNTETGTNWLNWMKNDRKRLLGDYVKGYPLAVGPGQMRDITREEINKVLGVKLSRLGLLSNPAEAYRGFNLNAELIKRQLDQKNKNAPVASPIIPLTIGKLLEGYNGGTSYTGSKRITNAYTDKVLKHMNETGK